MKKYICADCGMYQDSMDCKCVNCHNNRVVLADAIVPHVKAQFGDNWHAHCFPNATPEILASLQD
jgi:hypothetical protein